MSAGVRQAGAAGLAVALLSISPAAWGAEWSVELGGGVAGFEGQDFATAAVSCSAAWRLDEFRLGLRARVVPHGHRAPLPGVDARVFARMAVGDRGAPHAYLGGSGGGFLWVAPLRADGRGAAGGMIGGEAGIEGRLGDVTASVGLELTVGVAAGGGELGVLTAVVGLHF